MDEQLQAEICARIRQSRVEAGMTLEEMSDALGVTQRAYWNYEHNRVPFRRLSEVAEITGTTQGWLLRGDDSRELPSGLVRDVAEGVTELERSQVASHAKLDEILARLARLEARLSPGEDAHPGRAGS